MITGSSSSIRRRNVFLSSWVLYAGYYQCRRNFDINAHGPLAEPALILASFGATYAAGQLAGGTLSDNLGPRYTALAGAILSILCTLLLAFCTHPAAVIVLQMGNGFGQGFGWPSLLKLFGTWFHRGERDTVLGWWSTSYILGGLLATSLTSWLLAGFSFIARRGVSPAYAVSSLLLLIAALYFWRTTSGLPQHGLVSESSPEFDWEGGQHQGDKQAPASWRAILRNPYLQTLAGMYFFLKMTRYTMLFWLPVYLTSSLGYANYQAENTASFFELCGFLGPVVVGYASERWFQNQRLELATVLLFVLAFACLLHPMLAASSSFGVIASISLLGILLHGDDMLISGMTALDAVPGNQQGRAVGWINAVGSAGQILSPLLITVFVFHLGWTRLFDLFVCLALVSGAIGVLAVRKQEQRAAAIQSFPGTP